jgi:hypothetical protein
VRSIQAAVAPAGARGQPVAPVERGQGRKTIAAGAAEAGLPTRNPEAVDRQQHALVVAREATGAGHHHAAVRGGFGGQREIVLPVRVAARPGGVAGGRGAHGVDLVHRAVEERPGQQRAAVGQRGQVEGLFQARGAVVAHPVQGPVRGEGGQQGVRQVTRGGAAPGAPEARRARGHGEELAGIADGRFAGPQAVAVQAGAQDPGTGGAAVGGRLRAHGQDAAIQEQQVAEAGRAARGPGAFPDRAALRVQAPEHGAFHERGIPFAAGRDPPAAVEGRQRGDDRARVQVAPEGQPGSLRVGRDGGQQQRQGHRETGGVLSHGRKPEGTTRRGAVEPGPAFGRRPVPPSASGRQRTP